MNTLHDRVNDSIFNSHLFKNKSALITGGGRGIGKAIARQFISLGGLAIIVGRDEEKLQSTQQELGDKCQYFVLDIRDQEQADNIISSIKSIDFLVNNAGGQFPAPLDQMSLKGWKAVIDLNLNGTFIMSKAVFEYHFKKKTGKIVNITANVSRGFPLVAHSGAARAGVHNLTQSMAIEWAKFGISVNALALGVINSSGLKTYEEPYKSFTQKCGQFNYAYRLGTEAEAATAAMFLMSPITQYMTGQIIELNGGESLYHPYYPPEPHSHFKPEL